MNKTPEKNFSDKMPFTSVPKDLNKIKSKIALNMTKRQLICFGTAAVIGVPVYFFSKGTIGNSPAVLLMMAIMSPFFMLAMFEKDGLPAEKMLRNYIRAKFFWPGVRPYKTENFYKNLMEEEIQFAQKGKGTKQTVKQKHSNSKGKSKGKPKRR